MAESDLIFPPDFLWGTASSAHQVEGGNQNNDWWEWEQKPGHIKDGTVSLRGCDHYRRFQSDWEMARDFGQNAHRMSIEWSRIEPREGEWDDRELAHYRSVVLGMRDCGLEPMITLHHFTNPLWFAANHGWENPSAVRFFARYVARVVSHLSDLCRLWVTINEPMIYFYEGYLTRRWPPGRGGIRHGLGALRNMIRSHARAYRFIHTIQPGAQVGIAHNMRIFDAADPRSRLGALTAGLEDRTFNQVLLWSMLDGYLRAPLGRGEYLAEADDSLDFIGLNYYSRDMVSFALRGPRTLFARNVPRAGATVDGLGWEVYPEGLYRWLKALAVYGKPIYVTEHGVADGADALRPAYLVQAVTEMRRAIADGAPVRGYFHWTLFDNFEWAEGYSASFGLFSVDAESLDRRPKESAEVYAEICRANAVPADLLARYTPTASVT